MTSFRGRSTWPWLVGAFATAMALATFPLVAVDWPLLTPGGDEPIWVTAFVQVVVPVWCVLVLSVLSGFILSRRERSRLGWAFAASAVLLASTVFMQEYAVRALVAAPGSLPAGELAAWIGSFSSPGSGLLLVCMTLAVLMFPDGRLPGMAWWLGAGIALITTVGNVLDSLGPPFLLGLFMRGGVLPVTMPPALRGVGAAMAGWPVDALGWANLMVTPMVAGLLLLRLRRARGDERFQLRWLAYAGAIAAACWLLKFLTDDRFSPWASAPNVQAIALWGRLGMNIAAFVLIPVAVTIAILKYRLYDINLVINRTVVYGATSAAIAGAFWLGIVALQPILRAVTSGTELAVAASTLISFALFQPIRRRVQDAVDRRFDRSRYDAARTLETFADQLRDEVDLEALRTDLLVSVKEAMAPAHVSLWLRHDRNASGTRPV